MSYSKEDFEDHQNFWLISEFLEGLEERGIALYENDGHGGFTGQDAEPLITKYLADRRAGGSDE